MSSTCGKTTYMKGVRAFVYQTQEKGCGFAVVKMALIHLSGNPRYAYVSEPSFEDAPEVADVLSYAKSHGLRLRALKTLRPEELLQAAEFPLILLLRENGPRHLVFVTRRWRNRFRVYDPSRGPYWAKADALIRAFTCIYLKIESYEEGRDFPFVETPWPERGAFVIGYSFLALLPMAFLTLGFLFLDFSFPAIFVLASFGAMVASSLTQRIVTLEAMRRFDKRFIGGIDEPLLRQRKELYVHYHAYKRAIFATHGEVIGRFATLGAAFFVFFLHDVFLAACCAIGLGILCIVYLLCAPALKRLGAQAEKDEETYLHGSLSEAARKESLTALSSRAERYGRILGAKEAGLLLLGLGLSSFACFCNEDFSLQAFLFAYVSIQFFLFEGLRLFQIEPILTGKKREETYFRVHILPRVLEKESRG